jgi:Bacterial EndoU nuclease
VAFDRYDDGVDGVKHLRGGGPDAGAVAGRMPAETRTRQECYEALRAADGKPVQASDDQRGSAEKRTDSPAKVRTDVPAEGRADAPGEARTDRSGWDAVDSGQRPPLDAIRITPERTAHILDGDADGKGGHRHGVGNPGKTEFPASWDDKKIMDNVHDVARRPDQPPIYQDWNSRWLARGTRDDVEVVVVVEGDGCIWTGWPRPGGPGVVRNPRRTDG